MTTESEIQAEVAYFRRLTWYLAEKTGLVVDEDTLLGDMALGVEGDTLLEDYDGTGQDDDMALGEIPEDEDLVVCEDTEDDKDLWLLETLAALPTRTNKVVSVAWGNKSVIYYEETNNGTITFTRNPRRLIDTVTTKDDTAHWISNYGLRLTDVASSSMQSNLSPDRPLVDHIAYLVGYIRQVFRASPETRPGILHGLHSYVFRSSFPKIHARIAYHARDLRPSSQNSKKKEKVPASFVDYTTIIMPTGLSKDCKLARIFEGNKDLDGRQRQIVIKTMGYEKHGGRIPERYNYEAECTGFEREIFSWLRSTFDLPYLDEKNPASVNNYIGTLILAFLTGVHTLASSTYPDEKEKEKETETSVMLKSLSLAEMEFGLRHGLQSVVFSGIGLSGLLSGTFFGRHLEHICDSEQRQGYIRWLKLITEHFSAVSALTSERYITRIVNAKVYVLEVLLHGSQTNMTSLEDSLNRIQLQPCLEKGDLNRLLKSLKTIPHGDSFGGTTHCKVVIFLLVFIAKSPEYSHSFPNGLMEHFQAINPSRLGISKRCCPICAALLRIIGRKLGRSVETCGGHNRISPCSLPPWTPPQIIQEITMELEALVRPILLKRVKKLRPSFSTNRGSATPEQTLQPPFFSSSSQIIELQPSDFRSTKHDNLQT